MDKLLDNAPCGFLSITAGDDIVEVNATLLKMLGYVRADLEHAGIQKLFTVAGNVFYQTHLHPLLKLQGKIEEVYLSLRSGSGDEIPVLVNAVRTERGQETFYDFVVVPMHNRKQYEDIILTQKNEAETANRSKAAFLSMISHDLRTPLTGILGWAQILKGKEHDVELVKKAATIIKRSALAQKALIEDILDLARITSGKLTIDPEKVNLVEIVKNAVEVITPSAESKGISIAYELDIDIVMMGDSNRLQQVLWNLLSNSIKFTPKGGRINIELRRYRSSVELEISDDGIGISAEFLPYVFDRFQQQDNSKTHQQSGLGLGLAITRHIVELHGGTIRVKSPGENMGTAITASFPAPVDESYAESEVENLYMVVE
jgi:PAS domain S-box-containing protein